MPGRGSRIKVHVTNGYGADATEVTRKEERLPRLDVGDAQGDDFAGELACRVRRVSGRRSRRGIDRKHCREMTVVAFNGAGASKPAVFGRMRMAASPKTSSRASAMS
jgi:hypothetical protein